MIGGKQRRWNCINSSISRIHYQLQNDYCLVITRGTNHLNNTTMKLVCRLKISSHLGWPRFVYRTLSLDIVQGEPWHQPSGCISASTISPHHPMKETHPSIKPIQVEGWPSPKVLIFVCRHEQLICRQHRGIDCIVPLIVPIKCGDDHVKLCY